MRTMFAVTVAVSVVSCCLGAAGQEFDMQDVSSIEQARLLRRLIPLPKVVRIDQQITVLGAAVEVSARPDAGDVEQAAGERLRKALGLAVSAGGAEKTFRILIGVCDADGSVAGLRVEGTGRLAGLPNSEQAYVIQPIGRKTLVLTALDPRGVCYAARTLEQLVAVPTEAAALTIPLANVVDWPDLAERGEWGGSANADIERLAAVKMNLVESHVSLGIDDEGRGTAAVNTDLIELGRLQALKFVPIITHLDHLGHTGVYQRYPEFRGQGTAALSERHKSLQAPCFSRPRFTDILSDWMRGLAATPGVTDVCAWLSEHHIHCSCENCGEVGQYALEARSLVRAWQTVREDYPNLGLRILLTQGSYSTNDKVLAEVPAEVGVTYYDGGRTYDSSREPMIYPLLEEFAAKGRWLGCYPQVTASWRIVCPWSGPQFIRTRMTEFVRKGLKCLCGYATPNNRLCDFNITAAAEWSWNSTGRDEREFAVAWATRRELSEPGAVGEWAVILGPVGWDVYGSRIPYGHFFGGAAAMIAGRSTPQLGQGMFRYFPSPEHIEQDLEACGRAMVIAQRLGHAELTAETRVIQGYVEMVKQLYLLGTQLAASRQATHAERVRLQATLNGLCASGLRTATALRDWERSCGGGLGGGRFEDTVDATEKTMTDIAKSLTGIGLRNPVNLAQRTEIGQWVTREFDKGTRITKRFDVTEQLTEPGSYDVGCVYTSGWWGATIFRVALTAVPRAGTAVPVEVSVDEHEGTAAYRSEDNVYQVKLEPYDPNMSYAIAMDIRCVSSVGRPENRQGSNGSVWMKKMVPSNWHDRVLSVEALTDQELAEQQGNLFKGGGLRVGVVQGGYGASSVLRQLRAVKGLNAQPLRGLSPAALRHCDVVVLPQPRGNEPMGGELVSALEGFVRNGKGLLTTHNAVGYRGQSPLLTDVCARGLEHVRDPNWIVTTDHPVTAGISRDSPLPHSYYDHIELEAGQAGVVLAKAAVSGRPVVIAGQSGRGRYVACGLCLGLGASDEDVPPTGAEKLLLENTVRWCGGGDN